MSRKAALILDFDGVVVATETLHFECWNRAFEELLGRRLEGDQRQLVGLSLAEVFAHWQRNSPGRPKALAAAAEAELLARKTELFYALGPQRLEPMPGLVPLVQRARARGWYVTIASRARRLRLLRTLEMIKLPAYFDLIMGDEDVVDPKTDRKRHSRTLRPFGIASDDSVVVEDSASGVRDARDCGIASVIGLTTSFDHAMLRSAGASQTVDHLDEVLAA